MGALVFNIFLVAVFGWAAIESFGWRFEVGLFPGVAACLGFVMVTSQLAIELWKRRRAHQAVAAAEEEADSDSFDRIGRRGAIWLFTGLACVLLLGIPVGLPLFVALLARYGFNESWYLAIGIAAAVVFLVLVVFGGIFGAIWADPLLLQAFSD